jgi:hypothetical protein
MKKRTDKEIKEAIKKSIEAKKKALTEGQIIFKGYGNSKI